jgi:DnaK suppressor protein
MDAKQTEARRRDLAKAYKSLTESINRNRVAADEIEYENTEDEGDLATISHNKELLYNLHEGDYARLKAIRLALNAIDKGLYGECVNCGEAINPKRLEAVPWATMCLVCQEMNETAHTANRRLATAEEDEPTFE